MEKEFTGHYEHCNDCGHTWDYMDDRCPECGSPETTEMSAKEVKVHYCFHPEPEFSRILEMLDRHGD